MGKHSYGTGLAGSNQKVMLKGLSTDFNAVQQMIKDAQNPKKKKKKKKKTKE